MIRTLMSISDSDEILSGATPLSVPGPRVHLTHEWEHFTGRNKSLVTRITMKWTPDSWLTPQQGSGPTMSRGRPDDGSLCAVLSSTHSVGLSNVKKHHLLYQCWYPVKNNDKNVPEKINEKREKSSKMWNAAQFACNTPVQILLISCPPW